MKILITGAGGTVGGYFEGPDYVRQDKQALDVTRLDAVEAALTDFDWVVNLAAATDLDRCEREPQWAYRLNTVGAENVALAAAARGVRMLHVSTVGLFSSRGPFNELDRPDPVNVYAQTKLAGERAVRRILPGATVVRTAWVMGGGANDKKFVGKVRDRLVKGEPVKAVGDIVGSPTYAKDLAQAIRMLIDARAPGLFHVTNAGRASRFDMVVEMKRILGSSSALEEVPASTFPLPAPRPPSEVSESLALEARGLVPLRSWEEALEEYLTRP